MSEYRATPIEEIPQIRDALKKGFRSGKTRPLEFRRNQLIQLGYLVQDNTERLRDALKSDLGRPALETDFFEVNAVPAEVREALNNLKSWTKPDRPPFSFNFFPMRPLVRKEPKGTVLIISPFNFPIFLLLGPLCGALAAGNTVMLKPSELAPAFAALLAELVPQYLDPDVVRVVTGAIPETTKILEFQWDHILYTGSGRVAKVIAAAAAKHLSPITTELGGKSPVFIDPKSDLKLAARRILWGKLTNAGQTCVAPDYILIPREAQDDFIKELKAIYAEFYPSPIATSSDFSRIVSPQHTRRIQGLLESTQGEIVFGGEVDVEKKFFALTVVKDVKPGDSLLSEEIFGPVLPIVPVQDVDEAIEYVNNHDHPLALYVFSQDEKFKAKGGYLHSESTNFHLFPYSLR